MDDGNQSKGRNELAPELSGSTACVVRGEEQREAEHEVGGSDSGKPAGKLRNQEAGHFAPGKLASNGFAQTDRRIEMRSRHRRECQNQGCKCCARGKRVREQGDGNVSTREAFTHDARTDNGHQQEGSTEEFGGETSHDLVLWSDDENPRPVAAKSAATRTGHPLDLFWFYGADEGA